MKKIYFLLILLTIPLLTLQIVGSSPGDITLSADPQKLRADGKTTSTITAQLPENYASGIIYFSTNLGSFCSYDVTPGKCTERGTETNCIPSGGSCSVMIKSSTVGTATITVYSKGFYLEPSHGPNTIQVTFVEASTPCSNYGNCQECIDALCKWATPTPYGDPGLTGCYDSCPSAVYANCYTKFCPGEASKYYSQFTTCEECTVEGGAWCDGDCILSCDYQYCGGKTCYDVYCPGGPETPRGYLNDIEIPYRGSLGTKDKPIEVGWVVEAVITGRAVLKGYPSFYVYRKCYGYYRDYHDYASGLFGIDKKIETGYGYRRIDLSKPTWKPEPDPSRCTNEFRIHYDLGSIWDFVAYVKVTEAHCCPKITISTPGSIEVGKNFTVTVLYNHTLGGASGGGVHLHWQDDQADAIPLSECEICLAEGKSWCEKPKYFKWLLGPSNCVDYCSWKTCWGGCGKTCPATATQIAYEREETSVAGRRRIIGCINGRYDSKEYNGVNYEYLECSNLAPGSKLKINFKASSNINLYYRAWDNSRDANCDGILAYDRDPDTGTCSANCNVSSKYVGGDEVKDVIGCDAYLKQIQVADAGTATEGTPPSLPEEPEEKPKFSKKIILASGWNLISNPYQTNVTTSCIFGYLWGWDAKNKGWNKITSLEEMEIGKGYWIKVRNACSIEFSGTKKVTVNDLPTLYQGLNLIGIPADGLDIVNSKGNCDINTTYAYSEGTWYKYSFSTGEWLKYNSSSKAYESFKKESNPILESGKGYWIKVNNDCKLG